MTEAQQNLIDYEEYEDDFHAPLSQSTNKQQGNQQRQGHYAGIHATAFRDFALKPEL